MVNDKLKQIVVNAFETRKCINCKWYSQLHDMCNLMDVHEKGMKDGKCLNPELAAMLSIEIKSKQITIERKPQFKELRFPSEADFYKWLNQNSKYVVTLKDVGFDISTFYIHETGEVLFTDFNQNLYIGSFVNLDLLKNNECLNIIKEGEKQFHCYKSLIVDTITKNLKI